MRQLVPTVADVDPVRTYLAGHRPPPPGRPWIVVGMITSLDGATSIDGRSGALGGPADKAVFRAVRAVADVILVGAGTARAETYGPVRIGDAARAARLDAGRSGDPPRLAIVTASCDLDLDAALFGQADGPIVFTTEDADPERVQALSEVAEVRAVGRGRVDVVTAVESLAADGAQVVVCEGGPSLNAALAEAAIVDELCLSVSPTLVGGDSVRMVHGAITADLTQYELVSLLTEDGLLFGRWVRAGAGLSRPRTAGAG